MKITKRNGYIVDFKPEKISNAIQKACDEVNIQLSEGVIDEITEIISGAVSEYDNVETIQDWVESELVSRNYYKIAKAYILYRERRNEQRKLKNELIQIIQDNGLEMVLKEIERSFPEEEYKLSILVDKFKNMYKDDDTAENNLNVLIKSAVELTSKQAPKWEFIAARLLCFKNTQKTTEYEKNHDLHCFYDKIKYLTKKGLYGKYILREYSEDDIAEIETHIDENRNNLFNYSGLDLLYNRYVIHDNETNEIIETPQELFMGIALHLGIPEKNNRLNFVVDLYNIISTLKVTMATPTMSNARKPFHQLSSCFIDTVADSLDGIYRSLTNFAQVSKHGGGFGAYFGKVRAVGSDIRGYKGIAGGVIPWIKLFNDTSVAVDQLGVRQGACAVYLDIWHKDMPEFLQLRTNNGDDRMKAHDTFPAICVPNYFWHLCKTNINGTWYMMCPHEIESVMGFKLEDYYGNEWVEKYRECIINPNLSKRTIKVKDLVRLIIKSVVETGTPFVFNRDNVNEMNPNKHKGIIYSSNLCTEIAQNMKEISHIKTETQNGKTVLEATEAGDFVVCNLASLVLGNIKVEDKEELQKIVHTIVRALDNVITLNYYPIPYAEITNQQYRAIGLGTSGLHHMLVKRGIMFQSQDHLDFIDKVYEDINYFAIEESNILAKEKGRYEFFEGSEWQTGEYFSRREYNSERWNNLKAEVAKHGMRNGYLMAIAPTGSTSIIAGTTAGVDPVMNRYFLEEKKGQIVPRVAPNLTPRTFWTYENAHDVDQKWVVDSAAIRQRHLDQSQSVNLYITTEFTMRQILELYIRACEKGVKTIYYVRSKSLDIEDCDSCSA